MPAYKMIPAFVLDKTEISPIFRRELLAYSHRACFERLPSMRQAFPSLHSHPDANQLLEHISQSESADVAVLHWEGLFIAHPEAFYGELEAHVENLFSQGDWLVSGQIIDWQARKGEPYANSYSLFPITLLVNLRTWKKLGKPKWTADPSQIEFFEVERSPSNVHDNYTPFYIRRKSQNKVPTVLREGAQLIQSALNNGLTVTNFPAEARVHQSYLYPEDSERFNQILDEIQTQSAEGLKSFSLKDAEPFEKFIRQMQDQKQRSLATESEWGHGPLSHSEQVLIPLDFYLNLPNAFYFPCSSLKDFALCFGQGRRIGGHFFHFSSSSEEIRFKQKLISDWDGNVAKLKDRHEHLAAYFMRHFATQEHLQAQWVQFQKQEHTFIKANLLTEPEAIFESGSGVSFVNLSSLMVQRYQLLAFGTSLICQKIKKILGLLENHYDFSYLDFKRIQDDVQQILSQWEMRGYLKALEGLPRSAPSNGGKTEKAVDSPDPNEH